MADFSGFKSFNFSEGVPYMSVTKNGVTFNKSVVMKMQYPEYVQFLINDSTNQVALLTCSESDENAVLFCTPEKRNGKVLSIRWNTRDLLNTLSALARWDLSRESYRVEGQLLADRHAMLFELNYAFLLGDTEK